MRTSKATTKQRKKKSESEHNHRHDRRRLDVAVSESAGISRERAQALIVGGHVTVNGETKRKPSATIADGAAINVLGASHFVSRGAAKLERALDAFSWKVAGLRCLDVGASTGGFTDCLLQRGAASVVAVDVGYGHLAWPLRQNPKVIVRERTNFRYADLAALGAPFDFVCVDVSFISLTKLAAKLGASLGPTGRIVALIKPQFEAGREAVERGGVVRNQAVQRAVIAAVIRSFEQAAMTCRHITYSPIKGPAGNIEFLIGGCSALSQTGACSRALVSTEDIEGVVQAAHEALDK